MLHRVSYLTRRRLSCLPLARVVTIYVSEGNAAGVATEILEVLGIVMTYQGPTFDSSTVRGKVIDKRVQTSNESPIFFE